MKDVCSDVSVFSACGLSAERVGRIARETGFSQRSGGKIAASELLSHFCVEAIKGTVSNNDIAATMQAKTGVSASRQAYWLRLDNDGLVFFKAVLAEVIRAKLTTDAWALCPFYKRILIQDSTLIQLPDRLFACFSGVKNATTTTCNARIQGIYDLCAGRFVQFSIDPYSKNDLAVAPEIQVEAGDLVLRDRGYFWPSIMVTNKARGADTISRYKHKTTLYDVKTQAKIDLLNLLTTYGKIDMHVLAGENKDMHLRLMAIPVPEEVANLRRMKAKKETKGHAPSAEVLALMSWSIFITTIENPSITINEIMAIYGLRWRIENIFKTWKSHFSFAKLHPVSENQLRILLTARLIMISICFHHAYVPLCNVILRLSNKQLSLMKFMRYVRQNPTQLPGLLLRGRRNSQLLDAVARYCTYDKRKRLNFVDNVRALFADLSTILAR
ncbi:MAG: IS4 family transposase [Kiritimatiellia bacterium]